MKDDPIVGRYTEDYVQRAATAHPSGAAAKALKEARTRRKNGEDTAFYRTRNNAILVGPNIEVEEW